jgi:hypothetical protein
VTGELLFLSLVVCEHIVVTLNFTVVEFTLFVCPFSEPMLKLRVGGDDEFLPVISEFQVAA